MSNGDTPKYKILLSQPSLEQIINYKNAVISGERNPGGYLDKVLKNNSKQDISTEKFIEFLLATKKPKLFATWIKCDNTDWTRTEFEILGNINIAVPVEVYDNAAWLPTDANFKQHKTPFEAELLYTPGPLLRREKAFKGDTPDFVEATSNKTVDQGKYNMLIERRLSPLLAYAGETAKKEGKSAIIIIPGLGCGVFAGIFKGKLGKHLNLAIEYTIEKNGPNFTNIACVIFDPYGECDNDSKTIQGINYRVRPFTKGNGKSQLDKPEEYAEAGDDFSNCKLFKMVAWDHVSWPGNNFFMMNRKTDDGVAAAATSSMFTITNVKGEYANGKYYPPSEYENWKQVVDRKKIILRACDNVYGYTNAGDFLPLNEAEKKMLTK